MKKFKLLYCFVMFFFFVSFCSGAVDFTNSLIKCIKTENIEEAKNIIKKGLKRKSINYNKIESEFNRINKATEKQKDIVYCKIKMENIVRNLESI